MKEVVIKILFNIIIFVSGFACCYFIQPNKTETEIHYVEEVSTTSYVTKTIKEVQQETTSQSSEEKEKVIIRKIAVPCNCSGSSSNNDNNNQSNTQNSDESLSLNLTYPELKLSENGYMLVYEEIRESEKKDESSHTSYTEKEDTSSSIQTTSSNITEDKKETKINKDISILLGIGIESSLSKFEPRYSVEAHKKIIGPLWLGGSIETDKKLNLSFKLNASIGF